MSRLTLILSTLTACSITATALTRPFCRHAAVAADRTRPVAAGDGASRTTATLTAPISPSAMVMPNGCGWKLFSPASECLTIAGGTVAIPTQILEGQTAAPGSSREGGNRSSHSAGRTSQGHCSVKDTKASRSSWKSKAFATSQVFSAR
jgi:hypothetical protein